MASYYRTIKYNQSFDDVLVELITTFEGDGFIVVSRTDIQNILSERLDVAISVIEPSLVYRAIAAGNEVGGVIPYNVVVREKAESCVEVAALDLVSVATEENASEVSQLIDQLSKSIEKTILSF
jgi:uncharacterized protein (DUF302 family)